MVGTCVGRIVGSRVGNLVGPVYTVGWTEGLLVEGATEGSAVGYLLIGIQVGFAVGAHGMGASTSAIAIASSAVSSVDGSMAGMTMLSMGCSHGISVPAASTRSFFLLGEKVGCDCCRSKEIAVGRNVFCKDGRPVSRMEMAMMSFIEMRDGAGVGSFDFDGRDVGCSVGSIVRIVGWTVGGNTGDELG